MPKKADAAGSTPASAAASAPAADAVPAAAAPAAAAPEAAPTAALAEDVPVAIKTEQAAAASDAMQAEGAEAAVGEKRKAEGEADGAAGASDKGEKKQDKKQKKSKYDILVPIAQAGLVQRLTDFYGLGTEFPSDQLFTSSDTGNKIYFVSAAVRQMLAADGRGQLHTVHAGVKVFEKNPTKNDAFDYRLRQEGVAFLLPFMKKRIVKLDLADFSVLLTKRCMLFADLKTDGATQLCTDMGGGCMLFVLNSDEWTGPNSVYLAGWRGNAQLTLFVSKLEAQALSHKDDTKTEEASSKVKSEAEAPAAASEGEAASAQAAKAQDAVKMEA